MDDIKEIKDLLQELKEEDKPSQAAPKATKTKKQKGYQSVVKVGIKKLFPDVQIPVYKHEGDACCDIRAYRIVKMVNDMGVEYKIPDDFESITLFQGYSVRIGTGFKLNVPEGWSVNIEGRSGFSFDEGIVVTNAPGKAEYIYKGEYMVNLTKVSKKPTVIHKNDRIAQMEIVPQYKIDFEEVEELDIEKSNTRGENGLGSSGVK